MSTITSGPLPVMRLRLPLPAGATRHLLSVLVGAAVLFGGAAVSAGAASPLVAVRLDVAASTLQRATTAAGHSTAAHDRDSDRAGLQDRASCWRQAHRLGQDPSSCASAGAADRTR